MSFLKASKCYFYSADKQLLCRVKYLLLFSIVDCTNRSLETFISAFYPPLVGESCYMTLQKKKYLKNLRVTQDALDAIGINENSCSILLS